MTALVFQVPNTLWFSPMVHSVMKAPASPIMVRGVAEVGFPRMPVMAATVGGG